MPRSATSSQIAGDLRAIYLGFLAGLVAGVILLMPLLVAWWQS